MSCEYIALSFVDWCSPTAGEIARAEDGLHEEVGRGKSDASLELCKAGAGDANDCQEALPSQPAVIVVGGGGACHAHGPPQRLSDRAGSSDKDPRGSQALRSVNQACQLSDAAVSLGGLGHLHPPDLQSTTATPASPCRAATSDPDNRDSHHEQSLPDPLPCMVNQNRPQQEAGRSVRQAWTPLKAAEGSRDSPIAHRTRSARKLQGGRASVPANPMRESMCLFLQVCPTRALAIIPTSFLAHFVACACACAKQHLQAAVLGAHPRRVAAHVY